MTLYPFQGGAVIKVNLKQGSAHDFEKKKESQNLGDALRKIAIFSEEKITPIAEKTVAKTYIGIVSNTQYILFKSNTVSEWNNSSAIKDVKDIVGKVQAKNGKK